jgi:glyoxylase-like metal-dependent hydrolase (beta-lactamase superfamily II)
MAVGYVDGMTELRYAVHVSPLVPVRGDPLPDGSRPHWSPLSHTLIAGPTEAAVVDPPITVAQGDALGDWLAASGVRLTVVYLTHWHADHWLSTVRLLDRFPSARVHATPSTAARIRQDGSPGPLWAALFPGRLPESPLDFEITSDPFTIDGEPVEPVEAGHSDTDDTTVLHVPSLGLVVAGDVVYNNVHLYLAETGNGGAAGWHAALDRVAALHPTHVVAGHKDATRPDDPSTIDETRAYLDEALKILDVSSTRREFFTRIIERFPDRVNPTTTWLSASRLLPT